jgi:hypothetical protein
MRCQKRFVSSRREAMRRLTRSGSVCVSARVLRSAQIVIIASICSTSKRSISETNTSCSSLDSPTAITSRPSTSMRVRGLPPARTADRYASVTSGAATVPASIRSSCPGRSSSE